MRATILVPVVAAALAGAGCTDSASQVPTEPSEHPTLVASNDDASVTLANPAPQSPAVLFGSGDPGFLPMFLGPHAVGNSEVFQVNGRVHIGGTAPPAGRLQISDNFSGFGPSGQILSIHQLEPTGDITMEFSQSGFGAMGNVGVIRSAGPERFAILTEGRAPASLNLTLAEHGGNVGVGIDSPSAKLDVDGDGRFRVGLTVDSYLGVDGRASIGGLGQPLERLLITDEFSGGGRPGSLHGIVGIHQIDPTGDITLEFSQSGSGVIGNVGVMRSDGPERFAILSEGRTPGSLNLTLAEHGGNVGVGLKNPAAKLDVAGDGRFGDDLTVDGNLIVTGTKSSVATLSDGERVLLYAIESPQNWFEDFGSGTLVDGEGWIALEPVFAQAVSTEAGYHVFLTPNGECNGLYVAKKGPDRFLVRELGGGTSSVRFDYRIVARRAGFEAVRLGNDP